MKKFLLGLTVMALIFMVCGIAYAGSTAAQTFNVQISEINELTVSGNPGDMTVSTATAGSQPISVTDNSTTYSITTNGATKKITGQLNGGVIPGDTLNLFLTLTAPTTGNGITGVAMNTTSTRDLVTGISAVSDDTGNTIKYVLQVTAANGTLTSTSKTITLTLCAQ